MPIPSDKQPLGFLSRLFPAGLGDPGLLAELCPSGWETSPLFHAFHPTPEQRYEEHCRFLKGPLAMHCLDAAEKAKPPPSFEEFLANNPGDPERCVNATEEWTELLGRCLWDVVADNHKVMRAGGQIVDFGSFRMAGGIIDQFAEGLTQGDGWNEGDYLRFYMGTSMIRHRADLGPIYRLIFSRLMKLGGDWHYSFPRIYLVDFKHLKDTPPEDYDPSAALAAEEERRKDEAELRKTRRRLAEGLAEEKRRALDLAPPAMVQSYQEVYGRDPHGWPPDPDSPD